MDDDNNSGLNPFGAVFDLSTLDGTNGFRLEGTRIREFSGDTVSSAGDVNGDGFDDIIIAAPNSGRGSNNPPERAYVVFGRAEGYDPSFDLDQLDGNNGFFINNRSFQFGRPARELSVDGAGDVNGDGFDDIIIGAPLAPSSRETSASYVLFGQSGGFSSSLSVSGLDGSNGFRVTGFGRSGSSVSAAGDINGDGIDDIIIGARAADPNGSSGAGETHIVFGTRNGFEASIDADDLDGSNGFRLNGIDAFDLSGSAVSGAGDVNGDGIDDIIIQAEAANPNGLDRAGETYVVFGSRDGFAASFELGNLNGNNGFRIDGIDVGDSRDKSVSNAGDINGDGIDDIIIGASRADPNGNTDAGETYVVFGRTDGFDASFDLRDLDGNNGFRLSGIDADDSSGLSVSGAGDVNGDGIDDIIIGALGADLNGNDVAGETYVVFGRTGGFDTFFDLNNLDGSNGFRLDGINAFDRSGSSVSGAGDVNGDGIDDIIIGADGADPNGLSAAGETYVIFGRASGDPTPGTDIISNTVFIDANENGLFDIGESGASGIRVNLLQNGQIADATTTNSNGDYSFNVSNRDGLHQLEVINPDGTEFTTQDVTGNFRIDNDSNVGADGRTGLFSLDDGVKIEALDAGLIDNRVDPPIVNDSIIANTVFYDDNQTGIFDDGDVAAVNVQVNLLDGNGVIIASTLTDINGDYSFNVSNRAGTHQLEVVNPFNTAFTSRNAGDGSPDAIDSDVDGNGLTDLFQLGDGINIEELDAGLLDFNVIDPVDPLPGDDVIANTVFYDDNQTGIFDVGDVAAVNVEVRLLDSSDNLIDSTITNINGDYFFDVGNLNGLYRLEVINPFNTAFTTQDVTGNFRDDNDSNVDANGRTGLFRLDDTTPIETLDAGLLDFNVIDPGSGGGGSSGGFIGSTVFYDDNANGLFDGGDVAAVNVQVELFQGNNVVARTITDINGNYGFDDLDAGTYAVRVINPQGTFFTTLNVLNDARDDIDSDVGQQDGFTADFFLANGQSIDNIDAGLLDPEFVQGGLAFILANQNFDSTAFQTNDFEDFG